MSSSPSRSSSSNNSKGKQGIDLLLGRGFSKSRPFRCPYSPKCLEKLSEKGCEHPSNPEFGWYTEDEMAEKPLLGGPQGYAVGASEAFRTVSEEKFSEVDIQHGPGPTP